MYRVIVTLPTKSRQAVEQVASTIRNLYREVDLSMTVEVEEVQP